MEEAKPATLNAVLSACNIMLVHIANVNASGDEAHNFQETSSIYEGSKPHTHNQT